MNPFLDNFDTEITLGLEEAAQNIVAPDRDQVWSDILNEIEGINRKAGNHNLRKCAVAVALFTILITGLFAVADDDALADLRLFQTIKSVISNVVSISGVTRTSDEVPVIITHNPDADNSEMDLYTIEQAQQFLAYDIAIPDYVPPTYTLSGVFIREKNDNLSPAELRYIDPSGVELIVDENPVSQVTSFSYSFRNNDAEHSAVRVNDCEATLIYFKKTGLRKLLWESSDKYYIISASIAEREILKVAESLK